MSARHAYLAAAALVMTGAWVLVWAVATSAGRDDDRGGRPRG